MMKNSFQQKKTKILNTTSNTKINNSNLASKNISEKRKYSPISNSKDKNIPKFPKKNQLMLLKPMIKKTNIFENEKNILKSAENQKKIKAHKTPLIWSKKSIYKNKKEDFLDSNIKYLNTDDNPNQKEIEDKENLSPVNHRKYINKSFSKDISSPNPTKKVNQIFIHRKENSNQELSKFKTDFLKEIKIIKKRESSVRAKSSFSPIRNNKESSNVKENNQIITINKKQSLNNNNVININNSNNYNKSKPLSNRNLKKKNTYQKKNKINSPKSRLSVNFHNLNHSNLSNNNTIDSINVINYSTCYTNKIEESDLFEYEKDKPKYLTNEEKLIYGNREPKGYKKIKLLGKGGCGIVWLCIDSNGKEYAIKQISKKTQNKNNLNNNKDIIHNFQMAKREIEIINYLQNKGDNENMVFLFDSIEDHNDIWIISEKGGHSLSDLSLKIKGEFLGTERIYSIKKGHFLMKLTSDISQLKLFIKTMLKFIYNLSKNNIVHSDIKPDNILIEYNNENYSIKKIKVIDFGSAYFLKNPNNFSSNTPEYISPEITELLDSTNNTKDIISFLNNLIDYSWCIDIWSLAVTILEIIQACPLWMSYKAKVIIRGKTIFKFGLFGVKGRDNDKIYHIQRELPKKLKKIMKDSLINDIEERNSLEDLLSKMLQIDYKKRISPIDALKHPFLNERKIIEVPEEGQN